MVITQLQQFPLYCSTLNIAVPAVFIDWLIDAVPHKSGNRCNSSVIEYESLPDAYQRKMPAYPIPAVLIGKLAVDNTVKGQGLGRELLVNALTRAVRAAQ